WTGGRRRGSSRRASTAKERACGRSNRSGPMDEGALMRLFAVALTIHILGLIAVFTGLAIQHRAASRLRRSTRHEEAMPWAELLAATRPMIPSGAVMLLITGGYMTAVRWGVHAPWAIVAIFGVLLLLVTGSILAQRFGAIQRMISAGTGSLNAQARQVIGRTSTWSLQAAANGAALGTIWLMAAKSGWIESILVLALAATIGGAVGARLGRTKPELAQPS